MKSVPAEALYNQFVTMVREEYEADKVKDGVFGAMMDVGLVNDGPVTILIESEPSASVAALATNEKEPIQEDKS